MCARRAFRIANRFEPFGNQHTMFAIILQTAVHNNIVVRPLIIIPYGSCKQHACRERARAQVATDATTQSSRQRAMRCTRLASV